MVWMVTSDQIKVSGVSDGGVSSSVSWITSLGSGSVSDWWIH